MAERANARASTGRKPVGALLGVVPFFAYTTIFLLIPTLIVVVGAFLDGSSSPTLGNHSALAPPPIMAALTRPVVRRAATTHLATLGDGLTVSASCRARASPRRARRRAPDSGARP